MVKLTDFLNSLDRALNNPSCYLMGGFGQRLWIPDWYNMNYAWNKQNKSIITDHSTLNPKTYGFDCVGLIKSCAWNFAADPSKEYGAAIYQSNGVGDITIKDFQKSCPDLSTTFDPDTMEPGELLFYDAKGSHIGVYIGKGEAIESTPAWKCGVQRTLLPWRNSTNYEKLPVRTWWAHGHTSYIDYKVNGQDPMNWEKAYQLLNEKFGDLEARIKQLEREKEDLQNRINKAKEALN